ncbi:uncharacterized mitochondrial protein AtMg00810-like [Lycium barbarum]|uniref:uncharacterized mitochondrial protein AtMg00810-like n=1 Tax=Lycium barbarum TaxID=112863 RepID=UPI00293E921A|nr:uncharacterized mitochondrial protein AtMg00810-like [Lycium barbarum]
MVYPTVFVAVYIDDVILTRTDFSEIQCLKAFLHDQFKIKDLGKLHYFLGLDILYQDDGVLITQRKFTNDLIKEFDCCSYRPITLPLDPTMNLRPNEGKLLHDPTFYRRLVGKLNFLTHTRLDIAYSVNPTLGIFISKNPDCIISAFSDLDWAACPDSRKSVSGYIVMMGNSPISWKSKKQTTISLSSAEAEYKAIRKVVGELVWLERLLTELTIVCALPISVFCDS